MIQVDCMWCRPSISVDIGKQLARWKELAVGIDYQVMQQSHFHVKANAADDYQIGKGSFAS